VTDVPMCHKEKSSLGVTRPERSRRKEWLLAAALSCSVTLTNQLWVGPLTIYAGDHVVKRERIHDAILRNRLPEGVESWNSIGANGSNIRLLTVWTAEGVHRLTGHSVARSYRIIETCALLVCCVLLFAFLDARAGPAFALGGLLFFGCVLPLTYFSHYFHPWDKPSLVAWLAALICTHRRKWTYLGAVLAIGMLIKYDIILFPLFVLFAEFRRPHWRASVVTAAALFAVTVSVYVLLRWIFPGGFEPRDWISQVARNLSDIRHYGLSYPPHIGLGFPAALAVFGYSSGDRFARAGVRLCLVLAIILFFQANFVEIRAEGPLLVLLLPAAAFGLERMTRLR
jgi:hypothetical protein